MSEVDAAAIMDLKRALASAKDDAVRHAQLVGTQQVFIREISVFHREALLPLLEVVARILEQTNGISAHAVQVAQIQKFVKAVADRSKHYESQMLVERARQSAIDEQKRLEAMKPIAL